jgi:hypothetical protein
MLTSDWIRGFFNNDIVKLRAMELDQQGESS